MLSFLLVLAALLPLAGASQIAPPSGDNIAALGTTMSKGQVVPLTNPLCCGDIVPRTAANFDGSPNGTGVANVIGSGTSPNASQMSYSRAVWDPTRPTIIPVCWHGGGHVDYGDPNTYCNNVNDAAGTVLATGKPAAHQVFANGCRWIPATVNAGAESGVSVTNLKVTVTAAASNANTIQVSAVPQSSGFPYTGVYIGGVPGVPDYTTITNYAVGITTLVLSNKVTVNVGDVLQINSMFWCSTDKNGNWAPGTTHAYLCNAWVQKSNTLILTAGPYQWGDLGAQQPGAAPGVFNLLTKTMSEGTAYLGVCQWDGSTAIPMSPNYSDGFWYTFFLPFGGELQRCANSAPPSCTNILDFNSADGPSGIVVDPSPTSGAGKQAFFNDWGAYPGAFPEFLYVDDISHIIAGQNTACGPRQPSGNPYPPCYGTYTNNLFLNQSNGGTSIRAYTSDPKHASVVWDTWGGPSSQIVDITVNPGDPITATMSLENVTALPQVLAGQCINIWFLPVESTTAMRLFLLDNCGQLFLARL